MEKKTEPLKPDDWLKDLQNQPEIQKFAAEEMIECSDCGRSSPPTRLKCLYCGSVLPISAEHTEHLRLSLRKLEDWEKGFNVILKAVEKKEVLPNLSEVAALLCRQAEDVEKIFTLHAPFPLARVESPAEAEILINKLAGFGRESRLISDQQLNAETLPKRLRGLEFLEDKLILILFNADEVAEIDYPEIDLIVAGTIFERKLEATESLKKKDERKVLDAVEISNEEMVIDIYTAENPLGYRIVSKGFDFSCLAEKKTLFAKENIPLLLEKLRTVSPQAGFSGNYWELMEELNKVWEVSSRSDSGRLQRSLGNLSRTNIKTVSNLRQFTKFSRLQNIR